MKIKSTRLRYVRGKNYSDVTRVISGLSFKVEIKTVTESQGKATVWFIIPDEIKEFPNVELK